MKNLSFLCISFLLMAETNAQTATQPTGSGTIADPYLIASLENLYWVSTQNFAFGWSGGRYFRQTANIDATQTQNWTYGWIPIGGYSSETVSSDGNNGLYSFLGVYDGGGFEISNLHINNISPQNTGPGVGLFGVVGSSSNTIGGINNIGLSAYAPLIFNVNVRNANITFATKDKAGVLVGQLFLGNIINCSSSGVLTSSLKSTVGGLVGQNQGGLIKASYSICSVSGRNNVGVLVGLNQRSITECYSSGTASGLVGVGGLIGATGGSNTVSFSYSNSTASLSSGTSTYFGGLIGNLNGGTISNTVYWNTSIQATGKGNLQSGTDNSIGKTSAELTDQSTFPAASLWDFTGSSNDGNRDVWNFGSDGFPTVSIPANYWEGDVSSDLLVAGNWSKNVVPTDNLFDTTSANRVIIPASLSTYPSLNAHASVAYITLNAPITLGNYDLTITGSITAVNNSSYVATTGAGSLKQTVPSNASVAFPVGNSTYNPITITNKTGSSDVFGIRVIDEVYQDGSSTGTLVATANRVKRTWDITKSTPSANSGSGVDLFFSWTPVTDVNGTISIPKLYHYESGNWVKKSIETNTTYNVNAATLSFTGYTGNFSPFSIMDDGQLLPVRWLSFTGRPTQGTVELNWATIAEQNNSRFEVERSADGISFTKIGRVNASVISSSRNNYQFIDQLPISGRSFYRLKQVDLDGKYTYSSVLQIRGILASGMSTWSIPGSNKLTVLIPQTNSGVSDLVMYNTMGQVLLRQQVLPGFTEINLNKLVNGGMYFVAIMKGNEVVHTNKFIY